jgi:hypothetical protein
MVNYNILEDILKSKNKKNLKIKRKKVTLIEEQTEELTEKHVEIEGKKGGADPKPPSNLLTKALELEPEDLYRHLDTMDFLREGLEKTLRKHALEKLKNTCDRACDSYESMVYNSSLKDEDLTNFYEIYAMMMLDVKDIVDSYDTRNIDDILKSLPPYTVDLASPLSRPYQIAVLAKTINDYCLHIITQGSGPSEETELKLPPIPSAVDPPAGGVAAHPVDEDGGGGDDDTSMYSSLSEWLDQYDVSALPINP